MIRVGIVLSVVLVVTLLTGSPANAAVAFLVVDPYSGQWAPPTLKTV